MYTTVVGKTFLNEYNRREGTDYSAKDFFDEVLFKLFFDDKNYLFWAQNSPFTQSLSTYNGELCVSTKLKNESGKTKYFTDLEDIEKKIKDISTDKTVLYFKKEKRKGKNEYFIKLLVRLSEKERRRRLTSFHDKVLSGERDMSVAIGFPASDCKEYATTSGSVTDLAIKVTNNDVYLSWIGGMLSLGIGGAYAFLFNDPKITYATFEGWKVYRSFLNNPVFNKLPSNKIFAWNGQWLTYRFGKYYHKDFDFNTFVNRKAIIKDSDTNTIEIRNIEWSQLYFSLSNQYPSETKVAYISNILKPSGNQTIGFIPCQFKKARVLHQLYNDLFGVDNYRINASDFEAILGKKIRRACELGNIGLQALEPKDLEKYFKGNKNLKLIKPKIKQKTNENQGEFVERKNKLLAKDRENIITFQTYKTWLTAMLTKNKQELLDYTTEIAKALVKYREGARKRDRANLIEEKLFANKSKSNFLEHLIEIVNDDTVENDIIQKISELRDRAFLMNKEDFGYLWLLLKFDYAKAERDL